MKSLVKVLMILALGAIILMPGMAVADYTLVSQYANYDTYAANDTNGPPVARLDAYISSGAATFGSPGFLTAGYGIGFDSFVSSLLSPTQIEMTSASPPPQVSFDYQFAGSPVSDFTIDWNAFNASGDFLLHEQITVAGGSLISGIYNSDQYNPVPLPPSVLLMGSGLLGLVGLGWRRRKANA